MLGKVLGKGGICRIKLCDSAGRHGRVMHLFGAAACSDAISVFRPYSGTGLPSSEPRFCACADELHLGR